MTGWDGDSKRARGERAGHEYPPLVVPFCGDQYLEWFWELRLFLDSQDAPLTPSVVAQWAGVSGALLGREDHAILYAMDREYRSQMPKTVEYHQKRRDKEQGR